MFGRKLILSLTFVLVSAFFYANMTSAATHTIKTGEELDEIADRYETSVYTLLELNSLQDEEEAVVGLVLNLPDNIQNKPAVKEEKKR